MCHTTEGSWTRECTSAEGIIEVSALIWFVASDLVIVVVRMEKENDMLRKHFGSEWEAWRKVMPCKIFPGVYYLHTTSHDVRALP